MLMLSHNPGSLCKQFFFCYIVCILYSCICSVLFCIVGIYKHIQRILFILYMQKTVHLSVRHNFEICIFKIITVNILSVRNIFFLPVVVYLLYISIEIFKHHRLISYFKLFINNKLQLSAGLTSFSMLFLRAPQ